MFTLTPLSLSLSVTMFSARLLFAGYTALLFLVLGHHTCNARSKNPCVPSSCGHIHNITGPFRLKTDPEHCGSKKYELACENNLTVLYLNPAKYYVESINYNNYTIRFVDASLEKDNASEYGFKQGYPYHSFWPLDYYQINQYSLYPRYGSLTFKSLVFVSCPNSVKLPSYRETSPCKNGTSNFNSSSDFKAHTYVIVDAFTSYGEYTLYDTYLVDSCHIDLMVTTSLWKHDSAGNISCMDVHDFIVYGFELSWSRACCEKSTELYCDYATRQNLCYSSFWDTRLGGLLSPLLSALSVLLLYTATVICDYMQYHMGININLGLPDWVYITFRIFSGILINHVAYHAVLFIFGAPFIIAFFIYKWRRQHLSIFDNIEDFLQSQNNLMPVRYSYSNIKKITKGFKVKLGEGGYGSVYKGKLRSGHLAAIKMLNSSKSDGQDFINEVATIGRIHHVNVVKLIGFCLDRSKRALVYDFMSNGSLDKYLFSQDSSKHVSNEKMFEIALGVACGIEYLHQGCDMQILHFDIKPHNILLDKKFIPKISDFGLARLYPTNNNTISLTAARGTIGYMAPELFYRSIGGISYKADVYSYGMLLLEMAGRRKNLNAFAEHTSEIYFPTWIHEQYNKGKNVELGDSIEEEEEDERDMIKKMIIVALWCIQLMPVDRPSMHKVIEMLEGDVGSLEMPPKPVFGPPDLPKQDIQCSTNSTGSSNSLTPSDPTGSITLAVDVDAN